MKSKIRTEKRIPSRERELTGGLMMVMTATPSEPTSMVVLPFILLDQRLEMQLQLNDMRVTINELVC